MSAFYRELRAHFPGAAFVMVIRDPRDNIRSILNRLKIPGDLQDLGPEHRGEITRAWELIVDGRWLGLRGDNYIEMLAERWNYITDSYLENEDDIRLVKYEDFVARPSDILKTVGVKYDLDWEDKLLQTITGNIDNRNFKWQENMPDEDKNRLNFLLGDFLMQLGYEV